MSNNQAGLILLPNLLSQEASFKAGFIEMLRPEIRKLDGLFIESLKGARAFMKLFKEEKLNKANLAYVNEHTQRNELDFLLEPLQQQQCWGLISDAGLPVLADPGAMLVLRARQKQIPIRAVASTCSITAALMLSGLSAQSFVFHGYLPKEGGKRQSVITHIEKSSKKEQSTHVFIETPYRNRALFMDLLSVLHPRTMLSLAIDISSPSEEVKTQRIAEWKKDEIALEKRPVVFLINATL